MRRVCTGASLILLIVGCGATPPAPDAAAEDASISEDAPLSPSDVGALDGGASCTGDGAWVTALRGRDPSARSVLVAPGASWTELREALLTSTDPDVATILAALRAQAARPSPALAPGATPVYQGLASHALAAAWVGWLDDDDAARSVALADLETAGVDALFWAGADEVPIRVGASLVALAGAVDLLAASEPASLGTAQAALVRALGAVVAWYRREGELLASAHLDNFTMRLGAGVISAALLTPPEAEGDALLALLLSAFARTLDEAQTGGAGAWREGPFYLAYGMEVAPLAWAAVDAAWSGPDTQCVRCPEERFGACARAGVSVIRPSRDPVVPALVRWLGHLESQGGWLVPFDDARPVAWIPAPFEALAGVRSSRAWTPTLPNALGGSVQVGAFVAAARVRASPALPMAPRETLLGGAAHLTSGELEAYLIAEDAFSAAGGGHERPDPLAVTLAVGGTLMVGSSGYESYDLRALYSEASQASLVAIEGLVPAGTSAGPAPGATAIAVPDGAEGILESEDARWTRRLTLVGDAVTITDTLHLTVPRDVTWHWHLRGALEPGDRAWQVGTARCEVRFEGMLAGAPPDVRTEEAAQSDDGRSGGTHPVLRFSAALPAGDTTTTTVITCASL